MGNNGSKPPPPPPITKQEAETAKIKFARDRVVKYHKSISLEIVSRDELLRKYLAMGDKLHARKELRLKKQLENLNEKAMKQLEQLESIVAAIRAAEIQRDVIEAIAVGTDTLKSMNEGIGGVDRVVKVMDQAAEAQADTEEISNALASGGAVINEDTIDDELAELEKEAESKKVGAKRVDAISKGEPLPAAPLPDVPTRMPVSNEATSQLNSSVPDSPMPDAPKEEPKAEEREKKQERQMLAA